MAIEPTTYTFSYPTQAPANQDLDGILTELVPELTEQLGSSCLILQGSPASKRTVLMFRKGAKRLFYIRFVRKTARWLIEMGGGEPSEVLESIHLSKEHFDQWFGIEAEDIRSAYEHPPD